MRTAILVVLAACGGAAPSPEKKPVEHRSDPPKDPFVAAGLSFELPVGYTAVEVAPSARWKHERAVRGTDVEVRYGFAPAAVGEKLRATCGDRARCVPLAAALDAILLTAAEGLGSNYRVKAFPLDAVRVEFDALWGGVVGFDVDPAFGSTARGIAVVLHRDRTTAMFVGLFPGPSAEEEWMRAFHSLKFATPIATASKASETLAGTRWKCGDPSFGRMRFEASTWSVIQLSAAMAAMGTLQPFQTTYHEVTYLSDTELEATPFRIDNMEAGDRTPVDPKPRRVTYARSGDQLTIDGQICTLVRR